MTLPIHALARLFGPCSGVLDEEPGLRQSISKYRRRSFAQQKRFRMTVKYGDLETAGGAISLSVLAAGSRDDSN